MAGAGQRKHLGPRPAADRLRRLEGLARTYGGTSAASKLRLLEALAGCRLGSAGLVARLHEVLCFLRAYPDSAEMLRQVESMLDGFSGRDDLGWFREELANSGIAGTPIDYRFFWYTALLLARRWPGELSIDWEAFTDERSLELLERRLPLLMSSSESLALEEVALPVREWLDRLKAETESDGSFLVRRFAAMPGSSVWRERLFEEVDIPFRLAAGPTTPSRSRARWPGANIAYQEGPLETSRRAFASAVRRPPRAARAATGAEGRRLMALARSAMIARERDLDVFIHADRRDLRLLDCGRGLQFACYGMVPDRRQMLDAVYGFLILKNGMPIGYFLSSALFRSAVVAFNVFPTFRGAEAAYVYGRGLAMVRETFGADSFVIETYQLGDGNPEALDSGAWWFYYKLGFRPRDQEVQELADRETGRLARRSSYRSSRATLARLASAEMVLDLGRPRRQSLSGFSREAVGFAIGRFLAERYGADRERGLRECAERTAELLGAGSRRRWPAAERSAWSRWAPLVSVVPGVDRWPDIDKRDLVAVIRAKGGVRESDFVRRFDAHHRLRRAVWSVSKRSADG